MNTQVHIYTAIHKGQSGRLFEMSVKAGRLNYADQAAVDAFGEELKAVGTNLRLHADHEEHLVHPLLSDRMSGGAEKLEADHRVMHHMIDTLITHFEGIRARKAAFDGRQALGLEFYLALNRFIAFYVTHIDDEEENAQPVLWGLCTHEELLTTWNTIIASQTPEEATENLTMMFRASNLDELTSMLAMGKENMPPQTFQNIMAFAQRVLGTEEWVALTSRLANG